MGTSDTDPTCVSGAFTIGMHSCEACHDSGISKTLQEDYGLGNLEDLVVSQMGVGQQNFLSTLGG